MSEPLNSGSTNEPGPRQKRYFTLFDLFMWLVILFGIFFSVLQGAKWYGWIGGLIGLVLGPVIGYFVFLIFLIWFGIIMMAIGEWE